METGESGKEDRERETYTSRKKKHVGVKEIKQVGDYGKGKGSDPDPVCPN